MNGASRDELRRARRDADRLHREVHPAWRRALTRAVAGGHRPDEVAAVLGVATRRQVLRLGGTAVAGALVLAGCSDDDADDAGPADARSPATTDPLAPSGAELDVVLANTALSLEVLAVDTYRKALENGLVETAEVRDAILLFQEHHGAHRDALVGIVEAAGGSPFTTANPVVRAAFVDAELAAAKGQPDLLRLTHDLERTLAQGYVHATGRLSTAALRSTAAAVAAVEARHATVLAALGELADERPARYARNNPLPVDALVTE